MSNSKMLNIVEYLIELLSETKYVEDNELKRQLLINDIDEGNAELYKILMNNDRVSSLFVKKINDNFQFNTQRFIDVIQAKEYIPDSYTKYANEIGLTASGRSISKLQNVVLDFPHKDSILVGGMSKETNEKIGAEVQNHKTLNKKISDVTNDEVFLNEVISFDDIQSLKEPKAFANATYYDKDNVEGTPVDKYKGENLIIKGNNYVALNSLLPKYKGLIKLIYIDPPYNTGSDSFLYNDKFNHSTWLTFMKNRIDLAKVLLKDDGVLFVHCDNNEQAYLKVLLDETFGAKQFIDTITVVNNPRGRDYGGIANMHEFIHVYAKSDDHINLNKIEDPEKNFPYKDEISSYETRELRNRNTAFHKDNRPNLCYPFYVNPESEIDNGFLELSLEPKEGYIEVMPAKSMGIQTVWRWGKERSYKNLNVNLVGKKMKEPGRYMIVEKYRDNTRMPRSVWWDKDVNSEKGTVHLRKMFGKKVFSFPKPEELLSRIIKIATDENDLIMDFFMGSGTTQAVAHKMNRRYIGIEQMDYINTVSVPRLQKVIEGEQGGISKEVDWQGGGTFIYVELLEKAQSYVEKLKSCENKEELWHVYDNLSSIDDFKFQVKLAKLSPTELPDDIPFAVLQKLLISAIKTSSLYVNASETKDPELNINEYDRAFNISFYGGGED